MAQIHYNPRAGYQAPLSPNNPWQEHNIWQEPAREPYSKQKTQERDTMEDAGIIAEGTISAYSAGSSEHDPVANPKHYDLFPNEQAIDLIKKCLTEEEFAGYLKGNCLKYRLRAGNKDRLEQDIDKANWYQSRLKQQP